MSRFLKNLVKPAFNEGEAPMSTEVDVEVKVSEAEDATVDAIEATDSVDELVDQADDGAATAEVVEEIKDTVGEEGYSKAVARIVAKLGILEAAQQQYGITIAGHEALTSTGKNEEMAALVIKGCENMLQDWWKNLQEFFKSLVERVSKMIEFVQTKLRVMHKRADAMNKQIQAADRSKMSATISAEGLMSPKEFSDNIARAKNRLETAQKMLQERKAVEPTAFAVQQTTGQWALNDMPKLYEALNEGFEKAYAAGSINNEFKKLGADGIKEAKDAAENEQAKAKAKEYQQLGGTAAKMVGEALSLLNKSAAAYAKVATAFLKSADKKEEAPSALPAAQPA